MNKHTRSVSLIDGHTEDKTDAEVIKALECCSMGSYPACRDCPYHDDYVNRGCINKRNADIKDLINRQQTQIKQLETIERLVTNTIGKQSAEIEKLNVELVGMRGACESYKMHYDNAQAEIERDKSEHKDFVRKLGDLHSMTIMVMDRRNEIKSEAIKEFAERLCEGRVSNDPVVIAVKTELKMTEVSE